MEAKSDELGDFSAFVRATGHLKGYHFFPSFSKQKMRLWSRGRFPDWKSGDKPWRSFGTQHLYKITPDEWHQVLVTVTGDRVEGSLDGTAGVIGTSADFSRGWVAVGAGGSGEARFRNLRVTMPDGKVLWEGLPELPGVEFRKPVGNQDQPPVEEP